MLKALLFTGLFVMVTPAAAQNQAPPAAPQTPKPAPKDDDNRVICQNQGETGSRIASKRICMTAAQWKEHELRVHDQLDQMHSTVQPSGGPG
jgi:hypothetical protein